MRARLVVIMLGLASVASAAVANSGAYANSASDPQDTKWICLAELATGFHWSGARWEMTSFNVADMRYVISRNAAKQNQYTVKTLSEDYEVECGEPTEYGFIFCPYFGEFKFNIQTLRYMSTYTAGFIGGEDNNDNTPSLQIGSCTKF